MSMMQFDKVGCQSRFIQQVSNVNQVLGSPRTPKPAVRTDTREWQLRADVGHPTRRRDDQ